MTTVREIGRTTSPSCNVAILLKSVALFWFGGHANHGLTGWPLFDANYAPNGQTSPRPLQLLQLPGGSLSPNLVNWVG